MFDAANDTSKSTRKAIFLSNKVEQGSAAALGPRTGYTGHKLCCSGVTFPALENFKILKRGHVRESALPVWLVDSLEI
jgi:hypothetical protein